jgi:hypothetical protein
METPDSVEILSGLSADELVVIGNLSQLKPGQLVEAKERTLSAEKGEK